MSRRLIAAAIAAALMLTVTACGDHGKSAEKQAYDQIADKAHKRTPYIPRNDVEFKNYNAAQELFDDPATIIWCTSTWANPSAPIVTVPVAGKLTSSSTSFFSPLKIDDNSDWGVVVPNRSVDGLYHPDPPKYRFGFTPGNQYVDFYEMPTFCTTALTKMQRQSTELALSVDEQAAVATGQAEQALRRGDRKAAQRILEEGIK